MPCCLPLCLPVQWAFLFGPGWWRQRRWVGKSKGEGTDLYDCAISVFMLSGGSSYVLNLCLA
ncbi:hypothetical protein NMG60_11030589 [Bertholletia excelsa]